MKLVCIIAGLAFILDVGYFALDQQTGEVIRLTADFMQKLREPDIK